MTDGCQQAEALAGAIALGEANDVERDRYRRHIAACSSCLRDLGGEREIERVMAMVSEAKGRETWEPVLTSVQSKGQRRLRSFLQLGTSVAAIAIAASLGMHFLVASAVKQTAPIIPVRVASNDVVAHVTLEHRAPQHVAKPQTQPPAPPPRMVVVHNVITLKAPPQSHADAMRNASTAAQPTETKTTTIVARNAPATSESDSDVPVWRRGSDPIRHRASSQQASPPTLIGRAESIAMTPSMSVRDVVPLGGDAAINPEPPMIAYREGAEGTTAFEVSIDERGAPTKCTITKSSGYLVLDDAVCRAAMKARFSPKLVNGRAVPGVYHDAFTFRNSTNNEGIQQ